MIYNQVVTWLKGIWEKTDKELILPAMRHAEIFLTRQIEKKVDAYDLISGWKTEALEDFRSWLMDIPHENVPGTAPAQNSCDLYTLLSEFSGLRQEIKLQNREQHRAIKTLNEFMTNHQESADLFRNKSQELAELEKNIRKTSEKKSAFLFFDIRDALVRGHASCRQLLNEKKGFFRSPPKGVDSISEGYEMAVRRLDRALGMMGITHIETIGRPFDPKTMKVVDTRPMKDAEKGIVIEEILSGYTRENKILRTAEVIVTE